MHHLPPHPPLATARALVLLPMILVAGCATDAPVVADTMRKAEDCVRVTGSNVCRQARGGSIGGADNLTIVSGDAVRRSAAPIAGPEAMKVE